MAIYHLTTHTFSRGKGHSATAGAAYRAGVNIVDERTGVINRYENRGGVIEAEMFLPEGAPAEYKDRSILWNEAEKAERYKNAAVAREIEASLPIELDEEQRRELARAHAQHLVNRYGVAVDMAMHEPHKHPEADKRNYHVHYLLSTRKLEAQGFGEKCELELSGRKKKELGFSTGKLQVKEIRQDWAREVNGELERAGEAERIDERSFKDRGIDRMPSVHMGKEATQMDRRGEETRIGEENREIEYWNRDLAEMEWQENVIDLAIEREKRLVAEERRKFAEEKRQERVEREDEQRSEQQAAREKETKRDTHQVAERKTAKYKSYAQELDERRQREAIEQRRREEKTAELGTFYQITEQEKGLQEAMENQGKADTFLGRLSGKYEAASEQVEALRLGLENAKQREREAVAAFENQLAQDRQQAQAAERQDRPVPERSLEPSPANENEQEQKKGRDYGGFER